MKIAILVLLLAYLLICACMYLMQRRMLYFPVPPLDASGASRSTFDVGDVQLDGWVVNEGKEKALVYYGGNAEQIEQNIGFFQEAAPEHSVYLIPYRGYANNPGAPDEVALYRDAEAIFDSLVKNHAAVSLMGRSLGSGVATHIAALRSIDKLILVTPFDSIENVARENYWMLPVKFLIKDRFQSWKRAGKIKADTLVLVAGADEVISQARSNNLIEHLPHANTRVVTLNTAQHNDISSYPQYFEEVKMQLGKE